MTSAQPMSASSAFWPPDWSQMFPDILVAIITGVLVGLAVLWVERGTSSRRDRSAQLERASVLVKRTFIEHAFTYPEGELMPDDPGLDRLVREESLIDLPSTEWLRVPGYIFLRSIVRNWSAMRVQTEEFERIMDTAHQVMLKPDMKSPIRTAIRLFSYIPDQEWKPSRLVPRWATLSPDEKRDFNDVLTDPGMVGAARKYAIARQEVEAWRAGFVGATAHMAQVEERVYELLTAVAGQGWVEQSGARGTTRMLQKDAPGFAAIAGMEAYNAAGGKGPVLPQNLRPSRDQPGLRSGRRASSD